MKEHRIKIYPTFYDDILCGAKTFEIRRDDRDYRVGDTLILQEFDGDKFTGREMRKKVTYILRSSEFCKQGYVVMAIK